MRPPWEPTENERLLVKVLRACGKNQESIAAVFEKSQETIKKHFALELKTGKDYLDGQIASALIKEALGGNVTAQIFYLKTRCGWREVQEVEHTGKRPVIVYEEIPKGAGRKPKQPSSGIAVVGESGS